MPIDPAATEEWARQHKAAWEIEPLQERYKGETVQVGFELDLYARIPLELPPSDERQAAILALWDTLRDVAESLLPLIGPSARLDVEAFDAAGRLRPETQFAPEVLLKARLVQAQDYFKPLAAGAREGIKPLEDHLRGLGLRQRSW